MEGDERWRVMVVAGGWKGDGVEGWKGNKGWRLRRVAKGCWSKRGLEQLEGGR